jgi:hypothetical protein
VHFGAASIPSSISFIENHCSIETLMLFGIFVLFGAVSIPSFISFIENHCSIETLMFSRYINISKLCLWHL